jgi:ribonuclease D
LRTDGSVPIRSREGRSELAAACFRFLPERVRLDLAGWAGEDIFSHSV